MAFESELSALATGFFLGTVSTVLLNSLRSSGVITRSVLPSGVFPAFFVGDRVVPAPELLGLAVDVLDVAD